MRIIGKAGLVVLWLGAAGMGTAASSAASTGVETDVPPPVARNEGVPAARDGYVWAAGYWSWTGHGYSWIPGHYIYERRGAHWVPDHWDQAGSHWQYVSGHWEH